MCPMFARSEPPGDRMRGDIDSTSLEREPVMVALGKSTRRRHRTDVGEPQFAGEALPIPPNEDNSRLQTDLAVTTARKWSMNNRTLADRNARLK